MKKVLLLIFGLLFLCCCSKEKKCWECVYQSNTRNRDGEIMSSSGPTTYEICDEAEMKRFLENPSGTSEFDCIVNGEVQERCGSLTTDFSCTEKK
jgi:hypothetical protein